MFVLDYGYWHLCLYLAIVTSFDAKVQIVNCIIFLFSTLLIVSADDTCDMGDSGVSGIYIELFLLDQKYYARHYTL